MPYKERVLNPLDLKAYYDRFGKKQDSQGFYENPALDALVAHADFENAQYVFEFGCGTGKFADSLLAKHLPASANYLGYDVSTVMIGLANNRLAKYGDRVKLMLTDGSIQFDLPNRSIDRVVSTYVLDLLSEEDARDFLSESHRMLIPGGKVCLASLTKGVGMPSRLISSLWMKIFRMKPSIVGGCRPVLLENYVDQKEWKIRYQNVVTPFGVPSEVLILDKVA